MLFAIVKLVAKISKESSGRNVCYKKAVEKHIEKDKVSRIGLLIRMQPNVENMK